MNNDLSIFYLITQASVVVQLVMLILLLASVISWTFIIAKRQELNRAIKATEKFESQFCSSSDLSCLYTQLTTQEIQAEGLEKIFVAGYKEFLRMHKINGAQSAEKIENAQRAMHIELTREINKLDESLPFLATVGSTSPYIGLFGTVWGIMNAFRSLSTAKQATLAQVAPGIAEALVATAIGLFAAIPAVIAYNNFATKMERLSARYELFINEFIVLLQRQASM